MTTPQDSTNTTERAPRSSGSPPDEPRRASSPEKQGTMPPRRSWLWFALILLANFLLFRFLFPGPEAAVEVPYTFFKEQVRAGNVQSIYSQGDTIEGRFEEPVTYPHLQELHHRAPFLRGSRLGKGLDRQRGRDQRQAYTGGRRLVADAALRLRTGVAPYRGLHLALQARAAAGRRRGQRPHGRRSKSRQALRQGAGHQGHLRRRRGHRRGRERAGRDRGLPQGPQEVHPPRRGRPERRAPGGSPGNGQDALGAGCGG